MLRRFASLLVIGTLVQMSLGGGAIGCVAHNAAEMAEPQHLAMTPVDAETHHSPSSLASPCEECAPPAEGTPCEHDGSPGACASMSSCTANPAMIDAPTSTLLARTAGVPGGATPAPTYAARTPESPPPRV